MGWCRGPYPEINAMPHDIPALATKAAGLAKRVDTATYVGEANDLELRRIERDAQALMAADPEAAHTMLGGVAVLRGRTDDVRRHHRIAIEQSGHSAQAWRNYSVSLMRLGEMMEAFDAARDASRRAPDDADALRQSILAALGSAHFLEARDFCARWSALFPNPPPYQEAAEALASAVERKAFQEKSVREVLGIARDIRRDAKAVLVGSDFWADPLIADWFSCQLTVPLSPAGAVDLNEQLAERVTSRPDLMADPGMKFVPTFIGTRIDAGDAERTA